MLGHVLPSPLPVPREALDGVRLELPLPDGDRLAVRFLDGAGDTVVYLFHGLGSDGDVPYMLRSAAVAHRLGLPVYRVNHRGAGEGNGLARKPYHSGSSPDLSAVLAWGRARHPGKRALAIGFSLSSCALLGLLVGDRAWTRPDCAIAVNGPLDLDHASLALQTGFNRVYDLKFVNDGRRELRKREREGLLDRKYVVSPLSTIRDFDEIYTARSAGFVDRADYYARSSPGRLLERIEVPTVLLTAKDDPFVSHRFYLEAPRAPCISLHIEEHGGHMGYLTREPTPLGTRRWLDYALHEIIRDLAEVRG